MCDNGFSALNSKMGTTALRERLARSNSLPAAEELVTGSKAPSDLLQLKSGHSENFNFTRFLTVLCAVFGYGRIFLRFYGFG